MQAMVPASAAPAAPRMDSMSLPDDARYGADAVLLKSSRVSEKFFPQNAGTFSPSSSRVIRFDISSTNFLDLSEARLCATLSFSASTTTLEACLDGGLGGTIQRISIMNASGQLLERIDDYALLQTVLIQCSERARDDPDSLWLEENFIANITNVPASDSASSAGYRLKVANVSDTLTRDLCHKMHGAWFQTHKKKLLPPGVAFKVEIELVTSTNDCLQIADSATTDGTISTFNLSDVYMNIPSVNIQSQAFEDNTARLLSRGWSWTGSTYRRYSFTTQASTGSNYNIPDKSLALTGVIAIGRTTNQIGAAALLQNYVRDGQFFAGSSTATSTGTFNLQIGSQQYPANRIEYQVAPSAAASTASYKVSGVVEQIKAVLGDAPLGSQVAFGAVASDGTAGSHSAGTGFIAVQVGFPQGQGIDTQSASLPVQLFCGSKASSTMTVYCQATAMFRMEPGQGMMSVVSFI